MPSSSTLTDGSLYTFEANGFLPHVLKSLMSSTIAGVGPR